MDIKTARKIIAVTKETYENIGVDFAETRSRPWPEMEILVEKYVKNGQKVLDLGCGNGRILEVLKYKRIDYCGIDGSRALAGEARKKLESFEIKKMGNARIEYLDVLDLPKLKQTDFDAVFMFASFNHIPSVELRVKILNDLNALLKTGGYLLMTNWNLWQLGRRRKNIWRCKLAWSAAGRERRVHNCLMNKAAFGSAVENLEWRDIITWWEARDRSKRGALYYRAFHRRELKKLFSRTGFKVVENYYSLKGSKSHWWKAGNIVTVGKKGSN